MHTAVIVIGAGQAGLAMSRCLTERSIDHVVLERGHVANAWRTERWDSLHLLTPNWMTRLPGDHAYDGADPEGHMSAAEVTRFLDGYRAASSAPVHTGVTVTRVTTGNDGHVVDTTVGRWHCRAVVVATGATGTPHIPALSAGVPGGVDQLSPIHYRNPDQLGDGPVLVVGAGASGVQLADELARCGRGVVLATGEHVRVPRTYRGMDIHWWLDALGILDERVEERRDPDRARRVPSLQLVGGRSRRDVHLDDLEAVGVEVVGRLVDVTGGRADFDDSLLATTTAADRRLDRLLARIDGFVDQVGLGREVSAPDRPAPTRVGPGRRAVDLRAFSAVVWATGFRPDYPWLDPVALDGAGAIRHDRGLGAVPGLYVLGLPLLRRRKSTFIDGVGPDAEALADHLSAHLGRPLDASVARRPATRDHRK